MHTLRLAVVAKEPLPASPHSGRWNRLGNSGTSDSYVAPPHPSHHGVAGHPAHAQGGLQRKRAGAVRYRA